MSGPARDGECSQAGSNADCQPGSLWKGYGLGLLLAGALYASTVAPGSLWQDSGIAQNRTLDCDLRGYMGLALSHPLYYVFTILFQFLPFHESAYKTNLVSAFFGAITVANALLFVRISTGRWIGAAVAAISIGVAHTFWQHCALAEVYTLTTALLTLELLCAQAFVRSHRPHWLVLLLLINGLGVSNHMLAVFSLACDAGLIVWALRRGMIRWRLIALAALAWLVGAGLYLALVLAEWARGLSAVETLASALTGGYHESVMRIVPSGDQLAKSVIYLGLNFPTPLFLLVLAAMFVTAESIATRELRIYLLAETVIYLVWAVRYDVPDQYTFFIPAIVLLGIWVGLGAGWLARRRPRVRGWLIPAAAMPVLVYAALPTIARAAPPAIARATHLDFGARRTIPYRDDYKYLLWPWKTGYREPERFVQELSRGVPAGSILWLDSTAVSPVFYAQRLGRWPETIEVLPRRTGHGAMRKPVREEELRTAIGEGRVYVLTPMRNYCPDWLLDSYSFEKQGIVYRVVAKPTTGAASQEARGTGSGPPGCQPQHHDGLIAST